MTALILALLAPVADAGTLQSGAVEVVIDGLTTTLPMVRTEVDADVHGDLATVRLTQTFANPSDVPLNATYLFPLPADAAVHGMTLTAGDVVVRAEVQQKDQAAHTFQVAKDSGQQAALLTQHRPNVFSQDVANLPPHTEIRVEVAYVHAVPKRDGAFEWVLPLAVGPRYVPGERWHTGEPEPLEIGTWALPQGADTALPTTIEPGRVAVALSIDGGAEIASIASPSHPVRLGGSGAHRTAALSGEVANRDLVIRYALAEDGVAAGATAFADHGRGVVSLLIDPPPTVSPVSLTPREMVFVVDTSGSMSGTPLDTVKRFMHRAIDDLRPGDHFRIVTFSSRATEMSRGAIPFSAETASRAHRWIDALVADGGTEMRTGVNAAMDPPVTPGTLRTVVFLTDGYIGNDADVIRLVQSKDGGARLFALGVGGSVNRWLLEEMARVGRGTARIVADVTTADAEADALARRLAAPYLTDVSIDWGDAPVRDVSPAVLTDLFLGEPLRVMARFDRPGDYPIAVHGRIAGQEATLPLRLVLPEDTGPGAEALPLTWARWQIEDRMHAYLDPSTSADGRVAIEQQVTALGLEYGLATEWTSFVAVVPHADPQLAQAAPPPSGPSVSSQLAWGGNAAPEPATWAAMLLLAGMGGLATRRPRVRHSDRTD